MAVNLYHEYIRLIENDFYPQNTHGSQEVVRIYKKKKTYKDRLKSTVFGEKL